MKRRRHNLAKATVADRAGRRVRSLAVAGAALAAAWPMGALAQVATLGKGQAYFVNNGLQIWGLDQGASTFNYNNLAGANFNGVMWSYGQAGKVSQLTAGQRWGKWVNSDGSPATALDATEQSKIADLMALQVGDEQQSDLEDPNGVTKAWFQAAQQGNYFPNQLLYVNSFFLISDAGYANFIAAANPDAISFDSYPFDTPYGSVILPQNWLALAGRFRRHALSSYLGLGSNAPRPYGLYLQTYAASEGTNMATRHPGDVEMRWQQFAAWTMGFSFVDAFTVGGSSSLFNNSNHTNLAQPRYDQFKETSRQSRNLGPALTRLISYGYGPSIVTGKDSAGNGNPIPSDWLPFAATNAPPNQQYLTSLSAANTGTKNNGQPGDVYVGFFNPLLASYGDPAGTAYFMVTNALGPYLDDSTATVADCQQQITMNFDTQYSGISTLQRLRRSDGQLEIVPLTRTAGHLYQLQFTLEGGTGDLFKYNDGTPFVGFNNTLYWDNDASAAGNNTTTGASMGGTGTWDAASNKWHNGSSNGTWAGNRDAVFWGTAGTVTLGSAQAVNSLTFKSNGYTVTGSTLTMAGQFITAGSGVTATIGSALAGTGGIVKAGTGTVVLSNAANTYSGGTTITAGALQISADGALGAAPASFTAGNIILNGGTLKFGGNFDLNNNRGIDLGPAGGTIDTQGFTNPSGYTQAEGISGNGNLTKIGSGTFFMNTPAGALNSGWKGNLIIKQGIWKITERGGLPYNANADSVYRPGQITLDGGTWQIAANISVTSVYRGITIASGGGAIDTQSFNLTWGGPVIGNVPAATLNKIGSGTLTLNSAAGTGPATYSGNLNVNGGTLVLTGGTAMGDLASINLANTAGVLLSLTGSETIGSLSGGGTSGGNVALSLVTLTSGGNNASTNFAGVISGSGALNKAGTGTMTLSGANTYTGATTVSGGTLALARSLTASTSLTVAAGANATLVQGGDKALKTASVTTTGSGKLDVKDNKAILTSQALGTWNVNAYTGVTGMVAAGRNGGTWNGGGITTSMPDALNFLTTVAVAYAGEALSLGATQTQMWGGQIVKGSDTLVMYTYAGDLNVDGVINADDYALIDLYSQAPGASGYGHGDINYDGAINADDYATIDLNIARQGDPILVRPAAQGSKSLVVVPEPAMGLIALGAGALCRRRRR
jgi:autotransporter-associated beta strand protein